ncbi:LPXTG cell wall anchor domain-containing protein [Longispora sp. K20-0274]|uniref:LPXTG cell wall anchor domain-containing protein n=1 Tax=Longispora sp. K20-0274 TaxID=3088255 RepID=UPI00399BC6F2
MFSRSARAAGLAVATVAAALGAFAASPAQAAGTVDLKPEVGAVTFGAGSTVFLNKLTVTNAGTVKATAVTATVELVDGGATPALTFTAQRSWAGCTLVSPTKVTCTLNDLDATSDYSLELALPADERTHVAAGANPTPMPVKVKVTVASSQTDANPADNAATSGQVLRTVKAGSEDWAALAKPVTGKVGDVVYVTVASYYKGPDGYPSPEVISRYLAPAGTEWAWEPQTTCVELRPNIERRCTGMGDSRSGTPGEPGPDEFYRLPLRILSQEVAEGEFRVEGMGGDPNLSNNCARIIVTVEGAPARTVPAACAQPTPPTGTTSPTARATGGLPVTGTHTLAFIAAGAALLAVGTVALLVLRRRRRTFAA